MAKPLLYKGLALFTPGEDLVYCLDPHKQSRWHHHLCTVLQHLLDLSEPPLFLTPYYTATVDYWYDPASQQIRVAAEAHPPVWHHRPLLNRLFSLPGQKSIPWQYLATVDTTDHASAIEAYRHRHPQLWQHHQLIYGLQDIASPTASNLPTTSATEPYRLRLYVSGHTAATAEALKTLHEQLPRCLSRPYTLKVVDVARQPELAEEDQVTATPTLVRTRPLPIRRLVGSLDSIEKLQRLLSP